MIRQQEKSLIYLPFSKSEVAQTQTETTRIQAVISPIINSEESSLIGYVRVSQSLEKIDETLNKLDWGLCSGVFI